MCEFIKWWAQIAPGLTPLVALFAVLVAWRQLTLNRENERETTAKSVFREYLKLAFENPDLAEGNYAALITGGKRDKYEWFVGYFLWAAEEILAYARNDTIWRDNLISQAKQHRAYFNSPRFDKELEGYSKEVVKLVECARREPSQV
jgi:hypothetical protein